MADDQDSLETTVLGVPVKAKGINVVALVIMALATGGSMFLLWERTNQFVYQLDTKTAQLSAEHLKLVGAISDVSKVNETISKLIEEQNFIVLSDDAQRKEIKKRLRMPKSLSEKLDRGY